MRSERDQWTASDGNLEEIVGYDDSQAMQQMGVLEYASGTETAAEADD